MNQHQNLQHKNIFRNISLFLILFQVIACNQPQSTMNDSEKLSTMQNAAFKINFIESTQGSLYSGTSVSGSITPSQEDLGKSASIYVWVVGTGGKRNYLKTTGVWVNEVDAGGPIAFERSTLKSLHQIDINPTKDLTTLARNYLEVSIGYGLGVNAFEEMLANQRTYSRRIPLPQTAYLMPHFTDSYEGSKYLGTTVTGTVIPAQHDLGQNASIYVWIVGTGGKRNYLKTTGVWVNEQDSNGPIAFRSGALIAIHDLDINPLGDLTEIAKNNLQVTIGYGVGSNPFEEMLSNKRFYSKAIPLPGAQ